MDAINSNKGGEAMQAKRVYELNKSPIDVVVFSISQYKDRPVFDIRIETTTMNGERVFTPKGITMAINKLTKFAEGVSKLLEHAKEIGLLEERGDGQDGD